MERAVERISIQQENLTEVQQLGANETVKIAVFLDDIIVRAKGQQEVHQTVDEIIKCVSNTHIKLQPNKATFPGVTPNRMDTPPKH